MSKPTFAELFANAENTVEYWKEGCELYAAECKRLEAELSRLLALLEEGRDYVVLRASGQSVNEWVVRVKNVLDAAGREEEKAK